MVSLEFNLPNQHKSITVTHVGRQGQASLGQWSYFWYFEEILPAPYLSQMLINSIISRWDLNFTIRNMTLNESPYKRNCAFIQISFKVSMTAHHLFWENIWRWWRHSGTGKAKGSCWRWGAPHAHFTEHRPDCSSVTLAGLSQHTFVIQ